MSPGTKRWWVVPAAIVGALLLTQDTPGPPRRPVAPRPIGTGWADADAPRRIRELAAPIEYAAGWPGLGDFLASVAWTESRGNSMACYGSCGRNSARGWFQLRPDSMRVDDLGLSSDAIFDEPTSVALAAWYIHRLRPFVASWQTPDWLAIRRGFAYPSRVSDVSEDHSRSVATRERFETAVAKAGLPDSFMYTRAFPSGYSWPGIDAVMQSVGRAVYA